MKIADVLYHEAYPRARIDAFEADPAIAEALAAGAVRVSTVRLRDVVDMPKRDAVGAEVAVMENGGPTPFRARPVGRGTLTLIAWR